MIGVHTSFVSGLTGRSLGSYTSRLEIGVSVFFVISGFLLYRPFAAAHLRLSPVPRTGSFWVRRLKRIIPAYWLAFVVITYGLHADEIRHGFASVLIYFGFAQIYFPNYVLSGLTQAWSLCTEMSFYLVLPLWAALMGRVERDPASQVRVELQGLAALVGGGLVYRALVLTHHGPLARTMPNWLPGYIDLFSLGMLLAVFSAWIVYSGRRPAWMWHPAFPWVSWTLAMAAFVVVSNIGLPRTPVTPSPLGLSLARQTLYGAFAFFLVAPAVVGPQDRGALRWVLRSKPMALVGVVSYGVYLWHEAWIVMFLRWTKDRIFGAPFLEMLVVVTALAILSATASYVAVERPVRLFRWQRTGARAKGEQGAPVSSRLVSEASG